MKYLPLYYEWMETGRLSDHGLCTSVGGKDLELFEPTDEEYDRYNINTLYWGSGLDCADPKKSFAFTELRQTIVLFMAAMNGEL